jgi:hypothetical protein
MFRPVTVDILIGRLRKQAGGKGVAAGARRCAKAGTPGL